MALKIKHFINYIEKNPCIGKCSNLLVQGQDQRQVEAALTSPQGLLVIALSNRQSVLGYQHVTVPVFDWPMPDRGHAKHHKLAALVEHKCQCSHSDHMEQVQSATSPQNCTKYTSYTDNQQNLVLSYCSSISSKAWAYTIDVLSDETGVTFFETSEQILWYMLVENSWAWHIINISPHSLSILFFFSQIA